MTYDIDGKNGGMTRRMRTMLGGINKTLCVDDVGDRDIAIEAGDGKTRTVMRVPSDADADEENDDNGCDEADRDSTYADNHNDDDKHKLGNHSPRLRHSTLPVLLAQKPEGAMSSSFQAMSALAGLQDNDDNACHAHVEVLLREVCLHRQFYNAQGRTTA